MIKIYDTQEDLTFNGAIEIPNHGWLMMNYSIPKETQETEGRSK